MKAVIGNFKNYWERYKDANENIQLTVPFVGVTLNIPLGENGKMKRTRSGSDTEDMNTPFIESNTQKLIKFYNQYELEKEYKFSRSPYAESTPLRKGNKGFSYGINVDELEIVFIDAQFKVPSYLTEHSEKAVKLFKDLKKVKVNNESGEWQNDYSIRITKLDLLNKKIHIQPATYFDQIATNLTLDWASEALGEDKSLTIRNKYEMSHSGRLPPLRSSILANTLGVAVVLINSDTQEVLIPIRGNEQAIMDNGLGKFHCSASGVFAWDESDKIENMLSFDFFSKGMEKEIENEIGLTPEQYNLIPLAISRELVRGGKPQLFFVAETSLDIANIQSEMKMAAESWEFINIEDIAESNPMYEYIKSPLSAPQEMFTYEGWMAMEIAKAYFYKTEPPFSAC